MFTLFKKLFNKSKGTSSIAEVDVSTADALKAIRFEAGEKAEDLFEMEIRKTPWVAERINQTKESYQSYNNHSEGGFVKRGDFLLRKYPLNIEIEVKCFTVFKIGQGRFFKIPYKQWKGHLDMMKAFELDDVVFAFYERDGGKPKDNSLRMASMNYLIGENKKRNQNIYSEKEKAMMIPLRMTNPGFRVLEILAKNEKTRVVKAS